MAKILEGLGEGNYDVVDDGVPGRRYGVRWRANTLGEVFISSGMTLDIAMKVAEALNAKFPNGPTPLYG